MKRAVALVGIPLFAAMAAVSLWDLTVAGDGPTIKTFLSEYRATTNVFEHEQIARKYLNAFTVAELNAAIEREYPLSVCHVQGHGIGRAVYAQEQNFTESIRQCGNACNSGCFHGVIMGMFHTKTDTFAGTVNDETAENYISSVSARAKEICDDPDVRSLVLPIVCRHGMGHVFSLYTNVDEAVEHCKVFTSPSGPATCAGGVFMEYGKNPLNFSSLSEQGFSFCDRFPEYGTHCYRYIAVVMVKKFGGPRDAMRACLDLPGQKRLDCIFGIAFYSLEQRDFKTPAGPDRVCRVLTNAEEHAMCIDGGLWDIANRTGDTAGDPVCGTLAPAYRERCHEFIEQQQRTE